MSTFHYSYALIVEPDNLLQKPYSLLKAAKIARTTSIEAAIDHLYKLAPDVVLLSASYPAENTLHFLEVVKEVMTSKKGDLIPLILVVNLSDRVSTILGTTWGGRVAVLTSLSSEAEVNASLERLLT